MLVCPQTQSRNVLTSCVRLCIHVCKRTCPVIACCACTVWVLKRCGNVFFGNMLCVLCLPLFGALNGVEHQHVLCARGTHGDHSRWGVKLQAMESVQRAWGGRGSLSLHHSRTQQRQNLWRLPPTEGGGVTGAKYACTLMLGRWVCRSKQTTCDKAWGSYKSLKTGGEFTHSCDFVHPASYLKQFKLITWNRNLIQKSKKLNKKQPACWWDCSIVYWHVLAFCRPLSIDVCEHIVIIHTSKKANIWSPSRRYTSNVIFYAKLQDLFWGEKGVSSDHTHSSIVT